MFELIREVLILLGVVTRNPVTGLLDVNGATITAFNEYTWAQFITKNASDFVNTPVLITDRYSDTNSYAGVLVMGSVSNKWNMISRYMVCTAATIPAAATYPDWRYFITDVGVGGGSEWKSNGTLHRPIGSSVLLKNLIVDAAIAATATETLLANYLLPLLDSKLIWQDGDILQVTQHAVKTGTADIFNTYTRAGINGTTGDTIVAQFTGTVNTNDGFGARMLYRRVSSTSIQPMGLGNATPWNGFSAAEGAAAVTITNLDAAAQYIDISSKVQALTTDTALTLKTFTVELIKGA